MVSTGLPARTEHSQTHTEGLMIQAQIRGIINKQDSGLVLMLGSTEAQLYSSITDMEMTLPVCVQCVILIYVMFQVCVCSPLS